LRKRNDEKRETEKTSSAAGARRVLWWIAGVIVLAVAVFIGYRSLNKAVVPAGQDPAKLVGRWLRPDGGYILQLSEPRAKGELKAAYFNPRPINVSRAEWKHREGHLGVFVGNRRTWAFLPLARGVEIHMSGRLGPEFASLSREYRRT
jgi:hypothetical protein